MENTSNRVIRPFRRDIEGCIWKCRKVINTPTSVLAALQASKERTAQSNWKKRDETPGSTQRTHISTFSGYNTLEELVK